MPGVQSQMPGPRAQDDSVARQACAASGGQRILADLQNEVVPLPGGRLPLKRGGKHRQTHLLAPGPAATRRLGGMPSTAVARSAGFIWGRPTSGSDWRSSGRGPMAGPPGRGQQAPALRDVVAVGVVCLFAGLWFALPSRHCPRLTE
jgi:hypothetical protein